MPTSGPPSAIFTCGERAGRGDARANAASSIDLGPLANGQTKTAFFYLGSNATTTVNQTHTVSVFNGPPTSGALLTSQNFSFAAVLNTINASSNKVNSVVVSPSSLIVGGTFTITVTGATGTIGAAKVLDFTPAAYSSWRADALQLTGTTITLSGANTGTFTDTLAIPPGSIPPRPTRTTPRFTRSRSWAHRDGHRRQPGGVHQQWG
jgi:hypothetical protein